MKKLAFLKSILAILTFFSISMVHAQPVNVTVSGTPNAHSLTKWVSATEITNSQVSDNGDNVTVGIGTIVPAAKVTIQNGSPFNAASILSQVIQVTLTDDQIGMAVTSQSGTGINLGTFTASSQAGDDVTNVGLLGMGHSSGTSTSNASIGVVAISIDGYENIGVQAILRVSDGAMVQDAKAFYAAFAFDNGATVDKAYGLYLEGIPQGLPGSLRYGIYQDGDDDWNYFNGKVGIGNEAPAYDLDVVGTIKTEDLRVEGNLQIEDGAGDGFILQSDANGVASWLPFNPIQNWTSANNKLYPTNQSDKVIIGAMTIPFPEQHSDYMLSVDGKIVSKEVVCTLTGWDNWPDYVFSNDYKLPTIEEVENHISSHGHLPGVPPADEVLKNGLNVAEMNATLLQKVEELTLYIIQQNKRIEQLEAQGKQ